VTLVLAFTPLIAGLYWKRATTLGAYWAMGLGVATWLPMEFIAPEAAMPPQFAGFLMSIVGMVIGSLLRPEPGHAEASPHVRHSER
jgi:Na+/proline symporter